MTARGSAYNRVLREHGISKKMASTLSYLNRFGQYDSRPLHLGDAMSAVGLQRHGLARSSYSRKHAPQLVWSITQEGQDVLTELAAARREDQSKVAS